MPAAQAAKEKMSTPVFSLAASAAWPPTEQNYKTNPPPATAPAPAAWLRFSKKHLSPNSHPDHHLPAAVLYQGPGPAISNTATGLALPLYDSCGRPRCTGKERDAETGLDNFIARYYSSPQGRFTRTDPDSASASLFDPQRWNSYSYAVNNPLKFVDTDGRFPLLAITGGVGAIVGGVVGGGAEAFSQYARTGHIDSWGKVGTATLGGAIAGGVAGLTLGVGLPAAVAVTTTDVVVTNAASSALGGIVQRGTNELLGLDQPSDGTTELVNVGLDAATGAFGGYVGGQIADRLFPLPNVRNEIQLLENASKRSTRPAKISSFNEQVKRQTFFNSAVAGVVGGLRSEGIKFLWNWFVNPPPAEAKKKKDYATDITITYNVP